MLEHITGLIWSAVVWLLIAAAASASSGCTSMTVADLAGRALSGCAAESINLRGGHLLESPDLHINCRRLPAPEYRHAAPNP